LPSAIGNASRRNLFWPDEVTRPFRFCRHARARSARTGNAVTVPAARGAKRRDPCRMGHHFFLGAPAVCIDGLVRFADFGMSGSDLRNLWSRCVSECRGGKLMSPSRARAEQCGYLARGTSASVRSVRAWGPSGLAPCRTGKLLIPKRRPQTQCAFAPARSDSDESAIH
jgi:hypothetical protein